MKHELIFDGKYRDLETGKFNIDRIKTLNSNSCLSEMIASGTDITYEYLLACQVRHAEEEAREQEHQEFLEGIRKRKEKEEQYHLDLIERQHRQQEEKQGIRLREQKNLVRPVNEDVQLVYLGGNWHFQPLNTNIKQNSWKPGNIVSVQRIGGIEND